MATLSQPLSSGAAAVLIRAMRDDGLSVREIGRRTGLGKSTVHDVLTGKYGISATRAQAVGEQAARYGGMHAVSGRGTAVIDPATRRDRAALGRYWAALRTWRRTGDPKPLAKFADKSIRLRGGERFAFETDPDVLRELDDAGMLTPDEILEGNSP